VSIPARGARGPPAPPYPSPAPSVPRSFGGGAPLLSSSMSQSHYLLMGGGGAGPAAGAHPRPQTPAGDAIAAALGAAASAALGRAGGASPVHRRASALSAVAAAAAATRIAAAGGDAHGVPGGTAAAAAAAAAAGRRRSEDPSTAAPLLLPLSRTSSAGGGAAAAMLGASGGSRRSSIDRPGGPSPAVPPPPPLPPIVASLPASGAASLLSTPLGRDGGGGGRGGHDGGGGVAGGSPLFSLARAAAAAAHDPVVAAAIADTEAQLVQQAQREELEEEAAAAADTAAAADAAPSARGRLSTSRRPPWSRRCAALLPASFTGASAQTDAVYGLINAVVGIPTMVSFAAIVFQHPTYRPLLGQLARFSFLAAATHQLCFAAMSTLPFAVGQPQDTGLIVLSAIATSVAEYGLAHGLDARVVVATTLTTLALSTLLVGFLTLGVARLKLAGLVQYVPLPVVGGYLSFVGYFCLAAGVGLGTGTEIGALGTWGRLLTRDALTKLAPTLGAAAAILVCMRRARSPWALPILLGCIPVAFHAWLFATGTTLAEAQDAGWVLKPPDAASPDAGGLGLGVGGLGAVLGVGVGGHGGGGSPPAPASSSSSPQLEPFWDLYKLFISGSGICIPALLQQAPRALALWFVVVFGSTLDVAAIQSCSPTPLDFDAELATVGVSNIVVGLTGAGYSGSYIFSQTIFSMRAGVAGALHGVVLGSLEMVIFLLPVPVVQYLPVFFFGALLTVFGVEIAGDWLVHSRTKVTRAEYALLLLTFFLIVQLGLEAGVAAGAAACLFYFAFSYSRVHLSAFRVFASRSAAARPLREHRALEEAFAGRMAAVSLSGFIFFGSSVNIMEKVIEFANEMVATSSMVAAGDEAGAEWDEGTAAANGQGGGGGVAAAALLSGGGTAAGLRSQPTAFFGGGKAPGGKAALGAAGAAAAADALRRRHEARDALLRGVAAEAPRFLLLDFRRVLGVDATAAQTFGTLQMQLKRLGVELVLTRVRSNPTVERLFAAHGLIAPPRGGGGASSASHGGGGKADAGGALPAGAVASPALDPGPEQGYCRTFDTLNDGARYAEERFLALARAAGALPAQDASLTLREFLAGHLMAGGDDDDGGDGGDGDDEGGDDAAGLAKGEAAAAAGPSSASDDDAQVPASFGFAALGGSRRALGEAADGIARHSRVVRFAPQETIFSYGDAPTVVYLIMRGSVDVEMHGGGGGAAGAAGGPDSRSPAQATLEAAAASFPGGAGGPAPSTLSVAVPGAFAAAAAERHARLHTPGRAGNGAGAGGAGLCGAPKTYQCGVGSVVGGTDSVLQRPRAFRAVAASAVEAVAVESAGYRRMAREAPGAARALQAVLLRDVCLSEVYAYEALRRAAD